jgi:hypothetical protein
VRRAPTVKTRPGAAGLKRIRRSFFWWQRMQSWDVTGPDERLGRLRMLTFSSDDVHEDAQGDLVGDLVPLDDDSDGRAIIRGRRVLGRGVSMSGAAVTPMARCAGVADADDSSGRLLTCL